MIYLAPLLGILAAICSVTSFAPQAWKIIKTRDTSSLSTPMYVLTVIGFVLWTAFGVLQAQWTIAVPNFICASLATFILTMKLLPRQTRDAVAETLDSSD